MDYTYFAWLPHNSFIHEKKTKQNERHELKILVIKFLKLILFLMR